METATLNPEQVRRLDGLRNRQTRYELVLVAPAGRYLVAYCVRKGKIGALAALRARVAYLGRFVSGPRPLGADWDRVDKAWVIGGARVHWSGRTQRDAIMHGELSYIGD